MQPIHTTYPQFSPNQILSSRHLNQLYDYLGEQGRLTRTHLIGIGVVCGLEASLNATGTGLTISRGCGVTSAGHLVIWDEDEPLEFFAPYTMPEDIDYPFFDLPPDGSAGTYPLWELTTDRNDNAEARALNRDFLLGRNQAEGEGDAKVLLLLFECRAVDNRNCTPNNCDDKGRTIETAVRPLLVRRRDLEEIRRVLTEGNAGAAAYYALHQQQAQRLDLPTLRPPRFDVTNTRPATTRQLFETFRSTLSAPTLARVQAALDATYTALAPLLRAYAGNPFTGRLTSLTFLHDGRLLESADALAYTYYYDHLVTIIHAYGELRERAEAFFSLCCPDDRIFPRHLVLHHYAEGGWSDELRHTWVSAPVQNRQAEGRRELEFLFDRLVALVDGIELPAPAPAGGVSPLPPVLVSERAVREARLMTPARTNNRLLDRSRADLTVLAMRNPRDLLSIRENSLRRPIRITPSFLARPLSDKAIPFYYDPALLVERWNYALTRRGRSGENYGYHAITWNGTDDFVRRPLAYDLEPRNFLRIEGATGQPYPSALREIRRQITEFRLPIDVVALRTGDLSDDLEIEDYALHFADLEAQYTAFRARMLGRLAEVAVRFYDTRMLDAQGNAQPATVRTVPQAPLLRRLPGYRYLQGTVGEFYEDHYGQHTDNAPFVGGFDFSYLVHILVVNNLVRLENAFATRLRDLDFDWADQRLAGLLEGGRFFARLAARTLNDAQTGDPTTNQKVDLEEYSDQLDELVTAGDLDEFRALRSTYTERRETILRRQLFYSFQEMHPGLQCKAGTELGGTFVLVYHGGATESGGPLRTGRFRLAGQVTANGEPVAGARLVDLRSVIGTTTDAGGRFSMVVTTLPVTLRAEMTALPSRDILVTTEEKFLGIELLADGPDTNENPIPGIAEGTVVADFYLPYRCCGQGAPIHIFPPEPPAPPAEALTARLEQLGCTRADVQFSRRVTGSGFVARMRLTVAGGTPPYAVETPNGNRESIESPVERDMPQGLSFTVVDSAGQRSELTVQLLPPLTLQLVGDPVCNDDNTSFSHEFIAEGGRPPYTFTDPTGNTHTLAEGQVGLVNGITSGSDFTLRVTDTFGDDCGQNLTVPAHTCQTDQPECGLPCDGIARRQSYPLWAQRPAGEGMRYERFLLRVAGIALTDENQRRLALDPPTLDRLNEDITAAIQEANGLTADNYAQVMQRVGELLAAATDTGINRPAGLPDRTDALRLELLSSEGPDRLQLEFFACHTFELLVEVDYAEVDRQSDTLIRRRRTFLYSPEGVRADNEEIFPAFDRYRVDRCSDDPAPEPLCRERTPVSATATREGNGFFLSAESENNDRLRYWWDLQLGDTGSATGQEVTVRYNRDGISTLAAVLAVDPESGCFATATTEINT